jgi:transcriptional regulator with XRE-family HTH domain
MIAAAVTPRFTAAELRALRRELGWKQVYVCHLLGISERTLRRYETGRTRIPLLVSATLLQHAESARRVRARATTQDEPETR